MNERRKASTKNREFADIQITAEQLIRESIQNKVPDYKPPKMTIQDEEELQSFRLSKRSDFEKSVTRDRQNMNKWIKYAQWEESQGEYERTRSIYERALEQDYTKPEVWLKYADFEINIQQVNKARNVLERAVYLLPLVTKIWYKYVKLEQIVGNYQHVRELFEKWMEYKPGEYPWLSYIQFEIKINEIDNARSLFPRYVNEYQSEYSYLEWIKFEKHYGTNESVRKVFEIMGSHDNLCELSFYTEFAQFEESQNEILRARQILQYGIDHVGKLTARELFNEYIQFELRHGTVDQIKQAIICKQRFEYEDKVNNDEGDELYIDWYEYIQLEMNEAKNEDHVRELYERIIGKIPSSMTKEAWSKYVEFWVLYARFEEKLNNYDRSDRIYEILMKLIPHKQFTYKKIWRAYADYAQRRGNIGLVRRIYGNAIGNCPKDDIFNDYIEFEKKNNEMERVQKIQMKWDEVKAKRQPIEMKEEEDNQIKEEPNDDFYEEYDDLDRD